MKAELTYKTEGDYLIPDLTMEDQPKGSIGKYGLMRRKFLLNHRRGTYSHLLLSEELTEHLLTMDREAREMVELITAQLLKANPLPQTDDTMILTAHRNKILQQAEEMTINDLIYR